MNNHSATQCPVMRPSYLAIISVLLLPLAAICHSQQARSEAAEPVQQANEKPATAQAHLEKGDQARLLRKWDEAAAEYERAAQRAKDQQRTDVQAEALLKLGVVSMAKHGDKTRAFELLKAAQQLRPEQKDLLAQRMVEALSSVLGMKIDTGDFAAAGEIVALVVQIGPGDKAADFLFATASQIREAKDYDRAVTFAKRALEVDPKRKGKYLGLLGTILTRQKTFDDALGAFREAMTLEPQQINVVHDDLIRAYCQRGEERYARGEYEGSAADFKEAIALDPKTKRAHRCLGLVFWAQALRQQDQGEKTKLLGSARDALKTALQQDPTDLFAHRFLAMILSGHLYQEYRTAIASYRKVAESPMAKAEDHKSLALLLLRSPEDRDSNEAIRHALRACELTRNEDLECLFILSEGYFVNRETKRAVELIGRARHLAKSKAPDKLPMIDRTAINYYVQLGQELRSQQDDKAADAALEEALTFSRQVECPARTAGWVYSSHGRWVRDPKKRAKLLELARNELKTAIKQNENDFAAHRYLATLLADDLKQEYQSAVASLNKVVGSPEVGPADYQKLASLQLKIEDVRDVKQALVHAKRACERSKNQDLDSLMILAEAYDANGLRSDALRTIELAKPLAKAAGRKKAYALEQLEAKYNEAGKQAKAPQKDRSE